MTEERPPLPPFTRETALQKVQGAEDAWNSRDPERVVLAYSEDSVWRNRDAFVCGRAEIVEFLTQKWERELDYALRKDLWAFSDNRIAVRYQYESHDSSGQWWRSYQDRAAVHRPSGRWCSGARAAQPCESPPSKGMSHTRPVEFQQWQRGRRAVGGEPRPTSAAGTGWSPLLPSTRCCGASGTRGGTSTTPVLRRGSSPST